MLWCTCAVPYKWLIVLICTSRLEASISELKVFNLSIHSRPHVLMGNFESRPWVALLAAKATGTEQLNNF
jgi:hypothetical protein